MYMLVFYIQYITAYIKMKVLQKQTIWCLKFGHIFDGSKKGNQSLTKMFTILYFTPNKFRRIIRNCLENF